MKYLKRKEISKTNKHEQFSELKNLRTQSMSMSDKVNVRQCQDLVNIRVRKCLHVVNIRVR